jgi:hypothetical protein
MEHWRWRCTDPLRLPADVSSLLPGRHEMRQRPASVVSVAQLSRLFFVVGQVALQHLVRRAGALQEARLHGSSRSFVGSDRQTTAL